MQSVISRTDKELNQCQTISNSEKLRIFLGVNVDFAVGDYFDVSDKNMCSGEFAVMKSEQNGELKNLEDLQDDDLVDYQGEGLKMFKEGPEGGIIRYYPGSRRHKDSTGEKPPYYKVSSNREKGFSRVGQQFEGGIYYRITPLVSLQFGNIPNNEYPVNHDELIK